MLKLILYIIISFSIISGCKVLSKKQSAEVQSLGKAMTIASSIPTDFAKQYYDVLLESDQALASLLTNPTDKIQQLKHLLVNREIADTIISRYAAGYSILNKYSILLLALTDSSFSKELSKEKDAFVPSLDSSFALYNKFRPDHKLPINSLGGLVSKLIQEIGTRHIKHLQRQYLKELVIEADPVIADICDDYKTINFYQNTAQLANLGTTLDENYKTFIKNINLDGSHSDPYSYYKLYDPIYLGWKNKESSLDDFNKKNLKVIANLKVTHTKLKDLLNKNSSVKDMITSLQELFASINSLEESYKKFKKDLTPTT